MIARDRTFKTTATLRRDSTDLRTFEQVFLDNDYNIRRFSRWDDICSTYLAMAGEAIPLILDLGANVGLASLYFAKNWPKAHIISVEPNDDNYQAMRRNIEGFANIQLVKAAVASGDGTATIVNPEAQSWAYQTALAPSGLANGIPALSVPSLIAMAPASVRYRPFIAKIDIEGFESNLFSENTAWVDQFPVIIIELHDRMMPRQANSANFLRVIGQLNRDFIYHGENVFSISNLL